MEADDSSKFDTFIAELIKRLRESGLETTKKDAESIEVTSPNGLTTSPNLPSLYKAYSQMKSDKAREEQMDMIVRTLKFIFENDFLALTRENALPKLRPKLMDRWHFTIDQLHATDNSALLTEIPYKLIGEHVLLTIVLDFPDCIQSVFKPQLDKWEITFDEALEIALANVSRGASFMGMRGEGDQPGHCSTATRDCYDSVRFLLDEPYEKFNIGYPRWAFPAARDICCMAQANDIDETLAFNIDVAMEMADDDPKPLPPFPLINSGEVWRTWIPSPGTQAAEMLLEPQMEHLLNIYREQTSVLKTTAVNRRDFVLVQPLELDDGAVREGSGRTKTYWHERTANLLPKADVVIFPDRDNLRVDWDDLVQLCGDTIAPAEFLYPARWRTYGSPSEAQFRKLQTGD